MLFIAAVIISVIFTIGFFPGYFIGKWVVRLFGIKSPNTKEYESWPEYKAAIQEGYKEGEKPS
jgi:hypothetical protein